MKQIETLAEEIEFGEIAVRMKVHHGRVVQVVGEQEHTKKYSGNGSQQALDAAHNALVDAMQGKTGNLTLSFELKNGEVKQAKVKSLLT